jgi:hypothetical protein
MSDLFGFYPLAESAPYATAISVMANAVFDMPVCNYAPHKLEESREERGQNARRAVW